MNQHRIAFINNTNDMRMTKTGSDREALYFVKAIARKARLSIKKDDMNSKTL
jgi:hypothetical protein